MSIRRAEPRDIPDLLKLLRQVDLVHHEGRPDLFRVGTKYGAEDLAVLLPDDSRPVFVLTDEADARVLGYAFCILQRHENDPILTDIRTLYIDDLCVDEACRGLHIGTRLYRHVLAAAREAGCHNVTLNVWACNPAAMRFYEKCGLKVQKVGMETLLDEA